MQTKVLSVDLKSVAIELVQLHLHLVKYSETLRYTKIFLELEVTKVM